MYLLLDSTGKEVERCNRYMLKSDVIAIACGWTVICECDITITRDGHFVDIVRYRDDT
jgi:hypothetical protein